MESGVRKQLDEIINHKMELEVSESAFRLLVALLIGYTYGEMKIYHQDPNSALCLPRNNHAAGTRTPDAFQDSLAKFTFLVLIHTHSD